ncbi:MAG: MFS transporter [Terricaulis sp.]
MSEETPPGLPPLTIQSELNLYYILVGFYFFAFGMQTVLYPSLVTFYLAEPPILVGVAQMAISAPMFCFLLFGGVLAERARPGPTLAILHAFAACVSLILSAVISAGWLTYPVLLVYAVFAGASAAFIMPVRDAALNGVLVRETGHGRFTPIAKAAALTTAVQIGAQIGGILLARYAGASPAPFLAAQALALALGGAVALTLRAPRIATTTRKFSNPFGDIREGLIYAFRHPVMSPMLISAAYAGVFILGSFQVLFPLLIRDAYGGDATQQAGRLSALFAAFWGASFISAAALSRLSAIRRPGRALLIAHIVGGLVLLSFAFDKPFWAFGAIVVAWGLAAGIAISMSRTIVQSTSEPRYLGRVLAAYSMGFMGGAPIGSLLVGLAAEHFGPRTGALFPAIGLLVAASVLAATTRLWHFEPPAATDLEG